jgi:hypothetical protein
MSWDQVFLLEKLKIKIGLLGYADENTHSKPSKACLFWIFEIILKYSSSDCFLLMIFSKRLVRNEKVQIREPFIYRIVF